MFSIASARRWFSVLAVLGVTGGNPTAARAQEAGGPAASERQASEDLGGPRGVGGAEAGRGETTESPEAPGGLEAEDPLGAARAAAEAGRFAEARDLLQAALTVRPSPTVAFNLALMLRETGQLLQACENLRLLEMGRFGPLPDGRRIQVAALLREMAHELSTLEVDIENATGPIQVEIDGRIVARGEHPTLERPIDPGAHSIVVVDERSRVDLRELIEVGRAERRTVVMRFPEGLEPVGGDDDGLVWGLVLGGVAVAATAAVLTVLFTRSPEEPPLPDRFVGRVETLRW